jgi:hypothetical protein
VADPFGAKPAPQAGRKLTPADQYLDGGAKWRAASAADRAECMREQAERSKLIQAEQTNSQARLGKGNV